MLLIVKNEETKKGGKERKEYIKILFLKYGIFLSFLLDDIFKERTRVVTKQSSHGRLLRPPPTIITKLIACNESLKRSTINPLEVDSCQQSVLLFCLCVTLYKSQRQFKLYTLQHIDTRLSQVVHT
jgi:hypothetical protein